MIYSIYYTTIEYKDKKLEIFAKVFLFSALVRLLYFNYNTIILPIL